MCSLEWKFEDAYHLIGFMDEKENRIHEIRLYPTLRLNELRKADSDDIQLHTAIHESGHAIVAALTLRILPSLVVTKTVSSTFDGFCRINLPEKLITRDLIKKQIMISLAGFVAEKMVLGIENTSTGVRNDIEWSTELANRAIKEYAMGSDPIRIHVQQSENNDLFFTKEKYVNEALSLINECLACCEKLLSDNKLLLLKMSEYLTEHSLLRKETLGEMIRYYGNEPWIRSEGFITKDRYFNFKDIVKEQISQLESKSPQKKELIDKSGIIIIIS